MNHIKNKHDEQKEVQCDKCERTFSNELRLKVHYRLQHTLTKTYVCDFCGKSFKAKAGMEEHVLKIHTSSEEKEKLKMPCDYPECDYKGITKAALKKHIDRVHLKIKNHVCPHCSKGFAAIGPMKEHINGTHLGLKPIKCPMCDFCTAYTTIANEHKRIVHGNQRFECPFCNHVARYKNNLQKHINSVHKKKTVTKLVCNNDSYNIYEINTRSLEFAAKPQ